MKKRKYLALLVSACMCLNAGLPVMAEETAETVEEAVEEAAGELEEAVEAAEGEVAEAADAAAEAVQEAIGEAEEAAEALEEATAPSDSDLGFNAYMKDQIAKSIENYTEQYEANLEISKKAVEGTDVTLSVLLDDAGKMLLGMFAPVDISWLESLDLAVGASIQDGKEAELMTFYLNDKPIVTAEMQLDVKTMDMLMAVPALSPLYLKANYMDIMKTSMEEAAGDMPIDIDPEMMKALMNFALKFATNPPEKEVVSGLMDKYLTSFVDAFEEVENSEYTVELNGVSEDSTVLSGILTQSAAFALVKDTLTQARDDEDILSLIQTYGPEDGDAAASYQEAVDGLLAELGEPTEPGEDEEAIILRLCVNADGKTIGAQSALMTAEEEIPVCTAFMPSDGTNEPFYMDMNVDGEGFALYGNGVLAEDGLLDGSYTLDVNEEPIVNIDVAGYDPKLTEEEYGLRGTYTITPVVPEEGDTSETAQMLQAMSSFALVLDADIAQEGGECRLTVESSGADLGTVSMYVGLGDPVEVIDPETLGEDEVAAMDEEGMTTYLSTMDFTTILSNLTEAGMSEEVLNSLMGAFFGGGAEAAEESEPAA